MLYTKGTISLTNGSRHVTGNGTDWEWWGIFDGCKLSIDDGVTEYEVDYVDRYFPTKLYLKDTYQEETISGAQYQIDILPLQHIPADLSKDSVFVNEYVLIENINVSDDIYYRIRHSNCQFEEFNWKWAYNFLKFRYKEPGYFWVDIKAPGYKPIQFTINVKPIEDYYFICADGEPVGDNNDEYFVDNNEEAMLPPFE